tara:strand:- start:1911 stop:2054 length:144 start_codon:yes stop_codon:yes gene_type:complete
MIDTLVDEIEYHPHREEIISLMYQQIADDKDSSMIPAVSRLQLVQLL